MEGKSGASSRGNSAPIAYIKVVAVKKLVVGFLMFLVGLPDWVRTGREYLPSEDDVCT